MLGGLFRQAGLFYRSLHRPKHVTRRGSYVKNFTCRRYSSAFRLLGLFMLVSLSSVFNGMFQFDAVQEKIYDQLIKYEKHKDGSYGQETRGCESPGFKSEQWCQTDCWTGKQLVLPEALIEPMCKNYNEKELVLYVYSATYNFQTRQEVREIFNFYYDPDETGLLFLVGLPSDMNAKDEQNLHHEISTFHDILRINFTDNYDNLAFKGLGFFKWIKNCGGNVKYIAKADDNEQVTFGRLFVAYKFVQRFDPDFESEKIYCLLGLQNIVVHERKWRKEHEVDRFEFSGDYWPRYCRGDLGTFIPTKIIDNLLAAAQDTRVMRIEDAYFTGLLRTRACLDIYFIDLVWIAWLRYLFVVVRWFGIA